MLCPLEKCILNGLFELYPFVLRKNSRDFLTLPFFSPFGGGWIGIATLYLIASRCNFSISSKIPSFASLFFPLTCSLYFLRLSSPLKSALEKRDDWRIESAFVSVESIQSDQARFGFRVNLKFFATKKNSAVNARALGQKLPSAVLNFRKIAPARGGEAVKQV